MCKRSRWVFGVVALVLSGCVNAAEERQIAIAEATERCDKQGKQVHVVDIHQHGVANVTAFHTVLDFQCVGPGDPGFVAPPHE